MENAIFILTSWAVIAYVVYVTNGIANAVDKKEGSAKKTSD